MQQYGMISVFKLKVLLQIREQTNSQMQNIRKYWEQYVKVLRLSVS